MTLGPFGPDQLDALFLVFCRIAGILATAPIFESRRVPAMLRVALAALLACILRPVAGPAPATAHVIDFGLAAFRELIVGLGFGFVANLLFAAVSMAGEMADLQSGLAFASLVDPANEERTAIIGQIQMMIAWVVFLVVNGHHVLLRGISQSFTIVPLGVAVLPPGGPIGPVSMISRTFVTAIQIGAPVLGSVLVTDIALGLLARTVPQANLLAVGFPIKMMVAFVIILLSLPMLVSADRSLVPMLDGFINQYLAHISGAP